MAQRLLLVAAVFLFSCAGPKPAPPPPPDYGARFQHLLDSTLSQAPQVPGIMMRVESPSLGQPWTGAVGYFDRASKEPLKPTHSVRVASQTKTFVAVSILRLVEQGKVGLDSGIVRYISPESVKQLRRGGYDPSKITVRQLLHHTSGIFDYAMSPEYLTAATRNPSHRWTRIEQVKFAVDHGKPIGKPDEKYHYSDTGYVLLGEILERIQKAPLGQAVRDLVGFDKIGLKHTYFESLDSVPAGTGPRAHQYMDSLDLYHFDPSIDLWGGGGIVSDLEDLARFYRSVVRGEVLSKESTDLLLASTPQSQSAEGIPPGGGYGMGIGRGSIDGLVCYGHGGFFGTLARYCPEADLTVIAAIDRTPDEAHTLGKLIEAAVKMAKGAGK